MVPSVKYHGINVSSSQTLGESYLLDNSCGKCIGTELIVYFLFKLESLRQVGENCCDMGQNDTIGKIELIPAFVLSTDNTNC